eukprot:2876157-Pleurochrysis_carterae.AAC.2
MSLLGVLAQLQPIPICILLRLQCVSPDWSFVSRHRSMARSAKRDGGSEPEMRLPKRSRSSSVDATAAKANGGSVPLSKLC